MYLAMSHLTHPFQIYQITAHKIQVFNESNQAVKHQLLPQLPGGKTDHNQNASGEKNDDLLTAFSTKRKEKKTEWTLNRFKTHILDSLICNVWQNSV